MSKPRIYLDHAATSWPKSDSVLKAMDDFARQCGAAAGRGGYQSAAEADRIVAQLRATLARMINAASPQSISFHCNGTAALNAAIHGVVQAGDHIVTSAAEHNSVLRPLHHLQASKSVQLTIVPTNANGKVDPQALIEAVDDQTKLVALTHASNVTGCVQEITAVGKAIRDRSTLFLCDAAQTFGTLAIDVQEAAIDLFAAPGHKSSGGPLGTAMLYVSESAQNGFSPMIQGGTGSQSESLEMPSTMPTMLEPGNLNVPALAGWLAALNELNEAGIASRTEQAKRLAQLLFAGISEIEGVRVFGDQNELPITSLAIEDLACTDAAIILDAEFGVQARAGKHCAAIIHRFLGSEQDGTLRLSAGHTTTEQEVAAAIDSIRKLTATLREAS